MMVPSGLAPLLEQNQWLLEGIMLWTPASNAALFLRVSVSKTAA